MPGRQRVPGGVGQVFRRDILNWPAEEPAEPGSYVIAPSIPNEFGEIELEMAEHAGLQRRLTPRGVPLGRQRQQPLEHPGIPDPAGVDQAVEIAASAHDLLQDFQVECGVVRDERKSIVSIEEGGHGLAREEDPPPAIAGRRDDQRRDDVRILGVDRQGLGIDGAEAIEDAPAARRPFLERAAVVTQANLDGQVVGLLGRRKPSPTRSWW